MAKEFPSRIHGDGQLIRDESFYFPLSRKESSFYFKALNSIIGKAKIPLQIDKNDPQLPGTLLTLKQSFMISFSNGCPWPEKSVTTHIKSQEKPPTTLEELTNSIKQGDQTDGKHSFLFQELLINSSQSLKKELLSYHPWQKIDGQEDRNLPKDITSLWGKGGYGLAFDPPYFEVLVPLYKYIDDKNNPGTQDARYFAVSDFFEQVASKTKSIKQLIVETNKFLRNPQNYLGPYNYDASLNGIYL